MDSYDKNSGIDDTITWKKLGGSPVRHQRDNFLISLADKKISFNAFLSGRNSFYPIPNIPQPKQLKNFSNNVCHYCSGAQPHKCATDISKFNMTV